MRTGLTAIPVRDLAGASTWSGSACSHLLSSSFLLGVLHAPASRLRACAMTETRWYAERRVSISRKAICLLSGGLDSATCLALARRDEFECYALSFDYGQRHRLELDAAARLAARMGAERHVIFKLGLDAFGGSALTADIAVPKSRSLAEMGEGIPVTYVPARNTIFLSIALAWAEVLGSGDIFIGVNALDYSGYPDCRPEYIEAYERMANLATKAGVEGSTRLRIHTPLLRLSKAQIVTLGKELGVPFGLTHSCYDPQSDGRPCGECDACRLRRKGFEEAGIEDR
jgi:7-cyano-7-deazaguanine synthase